jgi:serine/threonine protein kinase
MKLQQYILSEKISEGSFGELYKGHHEKTGEPVAIKIEKPQKTPTPTPNSEISVLKHEAKVLQYLQKNGVKKVPPIYWYGSVPTIESTRTLVFIMPFYQQTLLEKLPLEKPKINKWMLQCLAIFQEIHALWVLHRDIKPQNFMVHNGKVILIDFGLASFYDANQENEPRTHLIGTPNYASIRIHEGNKYCWRDDLISLGYVYLFVLHNGREPWINHDSGVINDENGIHENGIRENGINQASDIRNHRNQSLLENKQLNEMQKHCDSQIFTYLKYVYSLKYNQIPNYEAIQNIFISN